MQVKEVMTREVEFIPAETTLKQAAEKMAALDIGFLPLGDAGSDRLIGVITDRDITVRAVAKGLDPDKTTVEQVRSEAVLYCYEGDDVDSAARSMHDKQVKRLIILNNPDEKRLCGVVTSGDLFRHDAHKAADYAESGIKAD